MPQDHPQTAVTIRIEEAASPEPMAHVTKERSVLQGLRFTQPQLARAKKEEELSKPGVYFLWARSQGPSEEDETGGDEAIISLGSRLDLYIGSSDDPSHRFIDHSSSGASFPDWTNAFVVSTANVDIDATQAKYVEVCLIEQAAKLQFDNDFYLVNIQGKKKAEAGQKLKRPNLTEGQRANAEYFLREVLLILPLVGIDILQDPSIGTTQEDEMTADDADGPAATLFLRPQGTDATGEQRDNGFLVHKGSRGRLTVAAGFQPPMAAALVRASLLDQGILKQEGDHVKLVEDHLFNSPSSAASVMAGGSKSGTQEWTDSKGRTLGEILDSP